MPQSDHEILVWAEEVKECHKKTHGVWHCQICNTNVKGSKCPDCEMTKEETKSISFEGMGSTKSTESVESSQSKKTTTTIDWDDSSDEDE